MKMPSITTYKEAEIHTFGLKFPKYKFVVVGSPGSKLPIFGSSVERKSAN